jgi:hypothetical protein
MESIATISFKEAETGEHCLVLVRAGQGVALLGLSRRDDGDLEVALGPSELEELVAALQRAASVAKSGADGGAV